MTFSPFCQPNPLSQPNPFSSIKIFQYNLDIFDLCDAILDKDNAKEYLALEDESNKAKERCRTKTRTNSKLHQASNRVYMDRNLVAVNAELILTNNVKMMKFLEEPKLCLKIARAWGIKFIGYLIFCLIPEWRRQGPYCNQLKFHQQSEYYNNTRVAMKVLKWVCHDGCNM